MPATDDYRRAHVINAENVCLGWEKIDIGFFWGAHPKTLSLLNRTFDDALSAGGGCEVVQLYWSILNVNYIHGGPNIKRPINVLSVDKFAKMY